jgi:hypothetical protein
VKDDLRLSLSKIHINFDLWISPAQILIVRIVAYYLIKGLQVKSLLITLKELEGSYFNENIIVIMLLIF